MYRAAGTNTQPPATNKTKEVTNTTTHHAHHLRRPQPESRTPDLQTHSPSGRTDGTMRGIDTSSNTLSMGRDRSSWGTRRADPVAMGTERNVERERKEKRNSEEGRTTARKTKRDRDPRARNEPHIAHNRRPQVHSHKTNRAPGANPQWALKHQTPEPNNENKWKDGRRKERELGRRGIDGTRNVAHKAHERVRNEMKRKAKRRTPKRATKHNRKSVGSRANRRGTNGRRSTKRSNQTTKTNGKVGEIRPPERPSTTDGAVRSRYSQTKDAITRGRRLGSCDRCRPPEEDEGGDRAIQHEIGAVARRRRRTCKANGIAASAVRRDAERSWKRRNKSQEEDRRKRRAQANVEGRKIRSRRTDENREGRGEERDDDSPATATVRVRGRRRGGRGRGGDGALGELDLVERGLGSRFGARSACSDCAMERMGRLDRRWGRDALGVAREPDGAEMATAEFVRDGVPSVAEDIADLDGDNNTPPRIQTRLGRFLHTDTLISKDLIDTECSDCRLSMSASQWRFEEVKQRDLI
ncbi:hypothetical protein DFP72DRAFT_861635 [Ephemerocybe angulata]|uniref:Uncharacterized protein n=1 Tax=Ephemerocybe angulata TaxID=980116 RepID=A0A8H6H754_9AGAR|nr:hypothetical protein DFP72DRAFT_861635 [Tulosesus angulatus]